MSERVEKFTPGPWASHRAKTPVDGEYDWCVFCEVDGKRHVIIEAFGRVDVDMRPNAQANASLISAAPDLYEALEKCITYIEQDKAGLPRTPGYVLGEIHAALKKATGET